MDTLRQQLARIQQQLAALSASQKMLTASLVAIMVMTFVWWGHYAGTSEMEPLFNTALSADDMQQIKRVLNQEKIHFEPSADQLLVPSDQKDYAISALSYAQVLPKDSSGSFEDIFSKMSPFASPSTNDKMYNEYKQNKLGSWISMYPGVSTAKVMMDSTAEVHIGSNTVPAASVIVQMRPGAAFDKKMPQSIAELIAGTIADLQGHPSRVTVIVDGRSYHAHDPDPNMPDGELNDSLAGQEKYYEQDIKTMLSNYGDVSAVVHTKIDLVTDHSTEITHPKIVAKEKSSEDDTSSSTEPQRSAEPGAQPNTGLSIAGAGGSGENKTETEHTKSESEIIPDTLQEEKNKPAGEPIAVSATVWLPRAAFKQQLVDDNPSAKQPTSKDVETAFLAKRDDIVHSVMTAVGITDDKQITVMLDPDMPVMLAAEGSGDSSSGGSATSAASLTGHVKEIGVGILALLSLFMVSMMVKKSAPQPTVAAAVETDEPITLGGNLDIAGEVSEGGQTLDGMELDDDAVKAQQMVEQVSTMVKENPDAAANMVKRWLNRS